VILPPELQNKFLYVPDFSGVLSLCHSRKPAVLHGGDGISADMLASQLINQKMWVVYQLIDGDVW
jgi:hypothetical protein